MGKKGVKAADGKTEAEVTFDPQVTPEYVDQVEELQEKVDTIMKAAKDKCSPLRESIAEIKKEAADSVNMPRKEFNTLLRKRRLQRQIDACTQILTDEQQDIFDKMEETLGDLDGTPLGRAARKSASKSAEATH